MREVAVVERKTPNIEYIVASDKEYAIAPVRELRSAENVTGIEYLLLTLGEENIKKLFGFSDEELQAALTIPSEKLFERSLSDEQVEKKFKTSMWRVFNLGREAERFTEVRSGYRTLFNEVAEGIENARTTFFEYAWGKNTKFYYKAILHPNPPENSPKIKIVMYVPDLHEGESWEEAWNREDFRVSTEKFIKAKSESDPKYFENYANLRTRDELEEQLMNVLVSKAEEIFNSKDPSIILSVSPAPPASKYAREMGYGATWYKQLSHARVYAASKVDSQTVILDGTTVFTYKPKWRLRKLLKESSVPNDLNSEAVLKLGPLSSHIDILATPVVISSEGKDIQSLVDDIDKNLNSDKYLFDYLSFFSHSATKWHRNMRLQNKEAADNIFGELSKEYLWRHYCILASGMNEKTEMLLKENLILMSEKGERLYAKYMTDQIEEQTGRKLSTKERAKLETSFVNATRERTKGGLCPTVSKSKKFKLDKDGNLVEDEDDTDEIKDCLIECRGKIVDYFQKVVKNCCWSAKAEKNVVYHSCPECGWYPGKPDVLVDESIFVETKKIDPSDESQSNKYLEMVTQETEGEFDDLMERSRKPNVNAELIDLVNGEMVYDLGFVFLRRKIPVEFVNSL